MLTVGMMQATIDQIVGVIPMGYRFVATVRAVAMRIITSRWHTIRRILRINRQAVFITVITVRVVQVPVMQIIHMIPMLNGRVPTSCAMLMLMVGMNLTIAHNTAPLNRNSHRAVMGPNVQPITVS